MAFDPRHGKDASVEIENAASSFVDIGPNTTSVSLNQVQANPDVTNIGSAGVREFIVGLEGSTLTLAGIWEKTLNQLLGDVYAAGTRQWRLGPQGNTTGDPRLVATAAITSYGVDITVTAATTWTMELKTDGVVTLDTFP